MESKENGKTTDVIKKLTGKEKFEKEFNEGYKFFENLSPEEEIFLNVAMHSYTRSYKCKENFEKVFQKGYKYDVEALNDLEQVHTDYLYALCDEFEKTLKICTGELFGGFGGGVDHVENEVIKWHNTVFFWKRFKLRLTFRDYLYKLDLCTMKNDNSNSQDIKDSTDEKLNEEIKKQNIPISPLWQKQINMAIADEKLTEDGKSLRQSIAKTCDYFLDGDFPLKTRFILLFNDQEGNEIKFFTAQQEVSRAKLRKREKEGENLV
jgi:hypothetical protein